MRKKIVVIILSIFIYSYNLQAQSNLLINGGFENDLESWNIDGGDAGIVTSDVYSGLKAFKIGPQIWSWVTYSQPISLKPGTTYRLSVYGKISAIGQNIGIGFKSNMDNSAVEVSITSTSYTKYNIELTTSFDPTAWYQIYIFNPKENSIGFLDDFKLAEVGIPANPVIDGKPDPIWQSIQSVALNNQPLGTPASDDLSAWYKAYWTADTLYVLVHVTDDVLYNKNIATSWENDNVEIYLDMGDERTVSYDSNDHQIRAVWGKSEIINSAGIQTGVSFVQNTDNSQTGYFMEFGFPWKTLGFTPAIGIQFGFDIMVGDNDGSRRDAILSWHSPTNDAWQNASLFGSAKLLENGLVTEGSYPADFSVLISTINYAKTLVENAVEGIKVGEYSVGSKAVLSNVVEKSNIIVEDKLSPQDSINAQINVILSAIAQFNKSKVLAEGATGRFYIKNTKIIDPNGKQFIPRGVNINGYEWVWPREMTQDIPTLVDCWKFNMVRVNCIIKATGNSNDNNNLDKLISAFSARGVVVMLEAHDWTGAYPAGTDLAFLKNWWITNAKKYKDNSYVWFNIQNEPTEWINNGVPPVNKIWYDVHNTCIAAIRESGSDNIVICDDHDWASASGGKLEYSGILQYGPKLNSTYQNIAYNTHCYINFNELGAEKLYNFFNMADDRNLCVFIGEFGVQGGGDAACNNVPKNVMCATVPRNIGKISWSWFGGDGNDLTKTDNGGGFNINKKDGSKPTNLSDFGNYCWNDTHFYSDFEKPSQPSGLQAVAITNNKLKLQWNEATDNVGIIGYKIFQDDKLIMITNSLNYTVTNLNDKTNYTFKIVAFDYTNNESLDQSLNVITLSTGINDSMKSQGFEIYPNPAKDKVYIKSTQNYKKVEIILSDSNGVFIKQIHDINNNNLNSFDLRELSSGLYFIKIIADNNISVVKVIK